MHTPLFSKTGTSKLIYRIVFKTSLYASVFHINYHISISIISLYQLKNIDLITEAHYTDTN